MWFWHAAVSTWPVSAESGATQRSGGNVVDDARLWLVGYAFLFGRDNIGSWLPTPALGL